MHGRIIYSVSMGCVDGERTTSLVGLTGRRSRQNLCDPVRTALLCAVQSQRSVLVQHILSRVEQAGGLSMRLHNFVEEGIEPSQVPVCPTLLRTALLLFCRIVGPG